MKKILVLGICILFSLTLFGCTQTDTNNYINDRVKLLDEYFVTVISIDEVDEISVLKLKEDEELTTAVASAGNHFIKVEIKVERLNILNPGKTFELEEDDFKIKSGAGVNFFITINPYIGDLDLKKTSFSSKDAITDYAWKDTSLIAGSDYNIVLFFEISKNISILDTIVILEVDLLNSPNNGIDIVLAKRELNN